MIWAYIEPYQEEIELSKKLDAMMEFKRKNLIHRLFLRLQWKAIDSVVVENWSITHIYQ